MIVCQRLLDQLRAWLDRLLGGSSEPSLVPVPAHAPRPDRERKVAPAVRRRAYR